MAAKKKSTPLKEFIGDSDAQTPTVSVGHGTDVRIGMSGWTHGPWRGTFYPENLAQKDELAYASRVVNSIEINGTFYALQKPSVFEGWYDAVPDNFIFSVKAPKYLTHVRRLKDFHGPLAYFLGSGVLHLKQKLGAILWQFPPFMTLKDDRFAAFLRELPKTAFAARDFVESLREEKKVRYSVDITEDAPLHHAFEMRNPSFACKEFVDLLSEHNVAIVSADSSGKWPYMEDDTADFRYLRLHGNEDFFPEGYQKQDLKGLEKRIETWASGKLPTDAKCIVTPSKAKTPSRIYVYFDNDHKIVAPKNACDLSKALAKKKAKAA